MKRIVCKEIYDSLVSYIGYTTGPGAIGGGTLVCAPLAARPDYNGNQVIIITGLNRGQARDINGVTTAGVVTPNIAFAVQVTAGTRFAIVGIRTTPAEVAALTALVVALMADVGDASVAALGSIYGILGNPAVNLATQIAALAAVTGLTDANGTITTTGAEQNVYLNNAPVAAYEPCNVQIDFSNQTPAETCVVRRYYRIAPAGDLIQKGELVLAGAPSQGQELVNISLEPNRYGIWVSLQRLAGAALGYDWAVFYRG